MPIPVAPLEERRLFAIGLMLVTFLLFTVTDASAKWLAQSGIPVMEAAFLRYAIHLAVIAALVLPRYGMSAWRTTNLGMQIVRALALLATTVLNFLAVSFLPLTLTASIMFSLPLLICALSVPMLGEKVGWRRWLAIIVGFIGVLIVIQPGGDFHPAILLSLGAVACSAFYFIFTRQLSGKDSAITMQLYVGLVGTVLLVPFVLGNWVWPSDPATWLAFFSVGVAALIAHHISTVAHRMAPASTLAPFAYVQIITMSAASWLLFREPPDMWLYIGAPVVIGSGLYIWLRERQLAKPVTPTAPQPDLIEAAAAPGPESGSPRP